MIDIVYPIKQGGSRVNDLELRYSLRSVEACLRLPVRNLYIFGFMPGWLHGATNIAMRDVGDKANNLRAKYQKMCELEVLSDPFLLLDDDHIFLAPTAEIPLHTRGMLSEHTSQSGMYGTYLRNAYQVLLAAKLPTRNYQIHYPMLLAKGILARTVALMTKPMVMASIYGNLLDGPTRELGSDFRVRQPKDFVGLSAGPFLSFPPYLRPEWTKFLAQRFPTASRWEDQPKQVAA